MEAALSIREINLAELSDDELRDKLIACNTANYSLRFLAGWALKEIQARHGDNVMVQAAADYLPSFGDESVQQCLRVAESFPPERVRENLSWSHHLEVTRRNLPEPVQEALLDKAAEEKLSTRELREQVKVAQKAASVVHVKSWSLSDAITHYDRAFDSILERWPHEHRETLLNKLVASQAEVAEMVEQAAEIEAAFADEEQDDGPEGF